jgi:glycosyltransferase involved in cell wall biosynthesis
VIPRSIHQFSPIAEYGEPITNSMLFVQRILKASGYQSEIYTAHPDQRIAHLLRPIPTFEEHSSDVLLVHHSLDSGHNRWISNLKCRRILIYHTTTPPLSLEGSELRCPAERDHGQLAAWAKSRVFDAAIGDSIADVEELESLGYRSAAAIPLLVDLDQLRNQPWNTDWPQRLTGSRNLLFVGAICENNRQLDLVHMIERLTQISNLPVRLILVGETRSPRYQRSIESEISRLGLGDKIWSLGKVRNIDLYALYRATDLYVSLSRHGGFAIPVLESMAFDLPIVASSAENAAITPWTGGLVLETHDPDYMAAAVKLVLEEPWLRRQVILGQRQSLARYERPVLVAAFQEHLRKADVELTLVPSSENSIPRSNRWQIEGPFDSSYSLAIVNRELARALKRKGETVALLSRDGPGPIKASGAFLIQNPDVLAMTVRAREPGIPAATLRNLYPPVVADMKGVLRVLANYAWEESGFPSAYVEEFNTTLDLICVASRFVAKVLRDNGVHTPIHVVGYGIDHVLKDSFTERSNLDQANQESIFRFLHISSGFPRKGLDALLAAWATAFCRDSPVMLLIKTFPNVHNQIEKELCEWKSRHPNHAPVELLNEELSDEAVRDLYDAADVVVCPSRGEGFGLPIAEALALGKAVVTTAYGGQTDFCTDQTAWLCDFSFAYARTHLGVDDSVWVEPNIGSLSKCLRDCYHASPQQRAARAEAGRRLVHSEYCWDAVAERTQKAVAAVQKLSADTLRLPKIGWVSTWNTRCGIASYSGSLTAAIEPERLIVFANRNATLLDQDERFVRRCWRQGWDDTLNELYQEIRLAGADIVVLQLKFGFFNLQSFGRLIERLADDGVLAFAMLHSAADVERPDISVWLHGAKQSLALARRILVHSVTDLNCLKAIGLVENVALFPMGMPQPLAESERDAMRERLGLDRNRLVLATFGDLLPHSGLRELIRATALLRRHIGEVDLLILSTLYPTAKSEIEYESCRQEIATLGLSRNVKLVIDFLEETEIVSRLAATDMVVYPYQQAQERANAAIRLGLASLAPVVCTTLPICNELGSVIYRLPGAAAEEIAEGLRQLATSPSDLSEVAARQRAWVGAHSWLALGRRLEGLLRGEVTDFVSPICQGAAKKERFSLAPAQSS